MKKLILLIVFCPLFLFSQDRNVIDQLLTEGRELHDDGNYAEAIEKYNQILKKSKYNLSALAERAFSEISLEQYDLAIADCKKAIEKNIGDHKLNMVFVTLGNAYQGLGQQEEAIKAFDDGIKIFPNYFHLFYNKGLCYSNMNEQEKAVKCFQRAISINPIHASSVDAMGRLEMHMNHKIPALLSFCRFLILEAQSDRAIEDLTSLKSLLSGYVEEASINNTASTFASGTVDSSKINEDNFRVTELLMAFKQSEAEEKKIPTIESQTKDFKMVFGSLQDARANNFGFYWYYLVPYFVSMNENGLVKPFVYIINASTKDPEITKWLETHKEEVDKFYTWSKSYKWKLS